MRFRFLFTFLFTFVLLPGLFLACQEKGTLPPGGGGGGANNNNDWLIPADDVLDGGPGKDGIPSIDKPEFSSVSEMDGTIKALDLVVGVKVGNEMRAYPHIILDWHEIVNDETLALNYCPLTGTAMAWSRTVNGFETNFGVSGLLYKTNLIPYDRLTDSEWSQILMKGVRGPNKGREAELFPVVETNWSTWKSWYPDSRILNTNTGVNRQYGVYPYGDYKTNQNRLLFPVDPWDDALPGKERVLGLIINQKVKVYQFEFFDDAGNITVIADQFQGTDVVVAGSKLYNVLVVFEREWEGGGEALHFQALDKSLPLLMTDQFENQYNAFGEVVSGPDIGKRLKHPRSMIGFWFALAAFYPNPEIYE